MSISYRPDIDGLRALAVLSVLFFHYGLTSVPGGFVGVDLFFVISGFLITRMMVVDEQQHGRISLIHFYNRRIRRIVPALAVVVLATLAVGYVLLMPGDYRDLGESAAWSAVGAGNLYFFAHTGYFDRAAELQPLLHLWTLGVEEQFYLVWPLLLALILRLSRSRRWIAPAAIALLVAVSFLLGIALMQSDPKAAFYLPHARAWELGLGALLVFAPEIRGRIAAEVAGVAGLALIGWSVISLNAATPFPGINALAPTLGAALLVWPRGPSFVASVLALPPMRFVGLISYSLYLWHWPILAFFRHYASGEMPTPTEALLLGAVAFVLATLSWIVVERPIRRASWGRLKMIGAGLGTVAASALAGIAIVTSNGAELRFAGHTRDMADLETMWEWPCRHVFIPELEMTYCGFGANWSTAEHRGVIWGDSHAEHFAPIVEAATRGDGRAYVLLRLCPPALGGAVRRERADVPDYVQTCAEQRRLAAAFLNAHPEIDRIVMASAWHSLSSLVTQDGSLPRDSDGGTLVTAGIVEAIDLVASPDRRIVVINQVPSPPGDPVPCSLSTVARLPRRGCEAMPGQVWARYTHFESLSEQIRALETIRPGVIALSPGDALCRDSACMLVVGGVAIYRDGSHLRRNLPFETKRTLADSIGLTTALANDGPGQSPLGTAAAASQTFEN